MTHIQNDASVAERVAELLELDETIFLADFHQMVEKARQKAWHDRHIKKKSFATGDRVLLYDSRYLQHPGKLQMHWLGPFLVWKERILELLGSRNLTVSFDRAG